MLGSLAMQLAPSGVAARVHVPAMSSSTRAQVVSPAPASLDLRVLPNPVSSSALVRFTLSDPAPARLDLFDVTGARVWSRELVSFGMGEHAVDLADGRQVDAGVYFLRLSLAGRAPRVIRVIVARP